MFFIDPVMIIGSHSIGNSTHICMLACTCLWQDVINGYYVTILILKVEGIMHASIAFIKSSNKSIGVC